MSTQTAPGLSVLGDDSTAAAKIQPTPLLTLPHRVRVPNVIPTDVDPETPIWTTTIFRIWAPGTAKHCRLCPRSRCKIFDIGLVEACSVGIDGLVDISRLDSIRSHEELFAARVEAGSGVAGEPAGGTAPPRLRILHGRRRKGD